MSALQYDGPAEAVPFAFMALLDMSGSTLRHVGSFADSEDDMRVAGGVYQRVGVEGNHAHAGIMHLETDDGEDSWRLVIFDRAEDDKLTPHGCAAAKALLGIYTDTKDEMLALFDFRFEALEA